MGFQPIGPGRAVVEQGEPLIGREIPGDVLKGIPQHRIGARGLINREVALKHAALGPELLNAEQRVANIHTLIGPPGSGAGQPPPPHNTDG